MEGIGNNNMIYDFIYDLAWQNIDSGIGFGVWLKDYTTWRYGIEREEIA